MATKRRSGSSGSTVDHPSHYNVGKIEVADFVIDQRLNFCLGNVVKYVCRAGRKVDADEIEDLRKAAWYLAREIQARIDARAEVVSSAK